MSGEKKPLKKVTIYDVAQEAGVSHTTVSRVINQKGYVSTEVVQRVVQAMTKLGFTVNQQARNLAGGYSYILGLILKDQASSYMDQIVQGIQTELALLEHELLLYNIRDFELKEWQHVAKLKQGLAEGFLLVLQQKSVESYATSLKELHIPYVLIDHGHLDNLGPSVTATNRRGAYDAVSYLLKLGHRRIGIITGRLDWGSGRERLAGYEAALKEYGIPVDPALICQGTFQAAWGSNCAQSLLKLPDPPTAIFASNDSMALNAISTAYQLGLRVPEDLSIIGFDDIPEAAAASPALTTIRQPLQQMGRKAVQMLLAYIQHPDQPPPSLEMPTELVIRSSCQPPKTKPELTIPSSVQILEDRLPSTEKHDSFFERSLTPERHRTQLLGLIFQSNARNALISDYENQILAGIRNEIAHTPYNLLFYDITMRAKEPSPEVLQAITRRADGFLLLMFDHSSRHIQALKQHHMPFVLINYTTANLAAPQVRATNRQGAYDAVSYLLESGHRRIGCITSYPQWEYTQERFLGYQQALKAYNLPIDPAFIYHEHARSKVGYTGAQKLLALSRPPTAIFCSSDATAIGAMEALQEQHVRVPDDISIIGFDDTPQASQNIPTLTTVKQPLQQIGHVATRLLLEYIEDPTLPSKTVEIPTTLIVRGSSRSLSS